MKAGKPDRGVRISGTERGQAVAALWKHYETGRLGPAEHAVAREPVHGALACRRGRLLCRARARWRVCEV